MTDQAMQTIAIRHVASADRTREASTSSWPRSGKPLHMWLTSTFTH
jgi:hypothetical protein